MAEITQEQSKRLGLLDKEEFILRLQKDIIEENSWITNAWPLNEIHISVNYAFDRATIAHGFDTDVDVQTFASLMFAINPEFDQHPEIYKVLSNTTLPTEKRWDILAEDPAYQTAWDELNSTTKYSWSVESRGRIEDAYPLTYMVPGFIALYKKIRKERYPFLAPGESLDDWL